MGAFSKRPRNRTASARRSSVSNYYRQPGPKPSRSPFQPSDEFKRKSRKLIVRTVDALIVLVVFFSLIYSMIVKPDARLEVNNLSYRTAEEYRQAANKPLQAARNRNKITLDENSITDSLQARFPEISAASVELPLFGERPIIHINVSPPSFWLSASGAAYVIDSNGTAVGLKKDYPKITGLSTVEDQSGFKIKIAQPVVGSNEVKFIQTILAECRYSKVPVKSVTLPPLAQELDLRTADRPYFVKFYLGGDPVIQAGQFLAARHNFDKTNSQPAEYLDVRVGGKVFYK